MAVATWVLVLLVCSVASTAALAVAGWRNRRVVGVDWFVATMALTTLWTALTVVEVLVHVRPVQLFTHLTVTAAAVAVPVVWFSFVVEYTGRGSLLDARDRPTGRALVVRDVTEDRRRQQRLNVLDRVFRHNIRNAMNAVVGPAAMLADRVDEADRELARTVADAGREVVALSESVRDIGDAMGRPVEPADVSVGRLVDDALAAVDPPDGVETTVDLPDGPTLRTDPRRSRSSCATPSPTRSSTERTTPDASP
jgi:signal transduction histidine kinase